MPVAGLVQLTVPAGQAQVQVVLLSTWPPVQAMQILLAVQKV
jgi:hypothetical protein